MTGCQAKRRLKGCFNLRQGVDQIGEYERVARHITWMRKAKSVEQALEVSNEWEHEVARDEVK